MMNINNNIFYFYFRGLFEVVFKACSKWRETPREEKKNNNGASNFFLLAICPRIKMSPKNQGFKILQGKLLPIFSLLPNTLLELLLMWHLSIAAH